MTFGLFAAIAFNLVDTWFVAKLGTNELGAMGFIFPVVMIISSVAIGLGIGASTLVARADELRRILNGKEDFVPSAYWPRPDICAG
ncbi:MAG: hypothetical protein GXO69_03980 [Acidobacteria bacterium]|nr:hypothetical protein [Acidobacteriota bacterium]